MVLGIIITIANQRYRSILKCTQKICYLYFTKQLQISLRSSENKAYKVGKLLLFLAFHAFCFFYLRECCLHFAPNSISSLVASSHFFKPISPLLAPKTPLFEGCFALLGHAFNGLNSFCLYLFNEYLCLSPRILQHFTLRLAPKCAAFSIKTHCI